MLSALGLAAAPPRRDATGSFEAARPRALLERARASLGVEPVASRVRYALRYGGQSFELAVDAPADAGEGELAERFAAAHERAYGYRDDGAPVELVTVTASVWGPAPSLAAPAAGSRARRSRQALWHGGAELDAVVIAGEPAPGETAEGPAIFALPEATLLLTPGWRARVTGDGTIEAVRS